MEWYFITNSLYFSSKKLGAAHLYVLVQIARIPSFGQTVKLKSIQWFNYITRPNFLGVLCVISTISTARSCPPNPNITFLFLFWSGLWLFSRIPGRISEHLWRTWETWIVNKIMGSALHSSVQSLTTFVPGKKPSILFHFQPRSIRQYLLLISVLNVLKFGQWYRH